MPKSKERQRRKLQGSRLKIKQLEGLQEDIDLESFNVNSGGRVVLRLRELITDGEIERTIEGASTVSVTISDQDGSILRSGWLGRSSDVKIDGLWFRLVKVKKSGDSLTLTWEDREIAILRKYNKVKIVAKNVMTRVQFIRVLVREVKEVPLRLICPDLKKGQKVKGGYNQDQADMDRAAGGWPSDVNKGRSSGPGSSPDRPPPTVTVKGELANKSQLNNIATVLDTGLTMGARTKVLIVSIMVGTQESSCTNLKGGDRDSVGFFQQRASQGWPASRNVAKDAQAFFAAAIEYDKENPGIAYWELAQAVQRSADGTLYKQWFDESSNTVNVYGVGNTAGDAGNTQSKWGGQTADDKSNWIRGTTEMKSGKQVFKKEDSWACMGRLADEIGYRRFMLAGNIYFISEPDLFMSRPRMVLSQTSRGVDWIDFDYDEAKVNKNSQIDVKVNLHRWSAPPGSVIRIENMGVADGKWLVTTIRRNIFKSAAEVTLKKPRAVIPEPADAKYGAGTKDPEGGGTETGGARQVAARILEYHKNGRYRDDNGQQLKQLEKVAAGRKLLSQCGYSVHMDARVLSFILWLLDNGIMVGTFAFVEDHRCNDGQHPKGQAVDISSLGENLRWYPLNVPNENARRLTMQMMRMAREFGCWDLICNGVGRLDTGVQALQIDNGKTRAGVWETDHTNHAHYSVAPGRRQN